MKRKLNPEQLVKDGFVQLKSLRQLQRQNILLKPLPARHVSVQFTNVFCSYMLLTDSMRENLGKVIPITRLDIRHWRFFSGFYPWPIECILR